MSIIARRKLRTARLTQEPHYWSMGYIAGYDSTMPIADINWSGLTHAMAFSAQPTATGGLDTSFFKGSSSVGDAWLDSLVSAGHAAQKKVFLTIGGANTQANYSATLADATYRNAFVNATLAYMQAHNLDGLDIDDEPITDTDVPDLILFIDALRAKRPSIVISMCFGAINTNLRSMALSDANIAALSKRLDMCNLMTYGLAASWSGWSSWHCSPLYGKTSSTPMDIDSSVAIYLGAGMPSRKLGIGAGFYGIGYNGCTAPYAASGTWSYVGADGMFNYNTIVNEYLPLMTRAWDSTARVPYLFSSTPKGTRSVTYLTYDDAQSVAEKSNYIKSKQLGGMIMWHVAHQYFPSNPVSSRNPLLEIIRSSLLQ